MYTHQAPSTPRGKRARTPHPTEEEPESPLGGRNSPGPTAGTPQSGLSRSRASALSTLNPIALGVRLRSLFCKMGPCAAGAVFLPLLLRNGGPAGAGVQPAHLWSGLGLPFLRMLLAVVSLKCRRPTVTFVTCSGGRLTLQRRGRGLRRQGGASKGQGHSRECAGGRYGGCLPGPLSSQASSRSSPPRNLPPPGSDTYVTGLKGRLLRSDCDCSMLMDWFRASSWGEAEAGDPSGPRSLAGSASL